MKTRATSFLLAFLAVVSLVLPVLAAMPEEFPEQAPGESAEIPPESAETPSESPEPPEAAEPPEIAEEETESGILLDGEPVSSLEYEIRGGVCYATVRSFVSMLDPEAVVEEEGETVCVSATTVTQVIPVEPEQPVEPVEGAPDQAPVDEQGAEESGPVQDTAGAPEQDGENPEAGAVEDVTGAADVVRADLSLLAAIGGAYFTANGRYLWVDGGLIDLNGAAAAPVRQLARVFNLAVGYDSESGQVLLNHQEGAEPYLTCGDEAYDSDALYWLSHIIYCESGNQPLAGKVAVGNVVMNRVADPRFPNTIYDVLFQKNQFSPVSSGSIRREPNWDSVVAAKLVLDGAKVTDALFFNGVRARAPKGRAYVTTIGDHAFYK